MLRKIISRQIRYLLLGLFFITPFFLSLQPKTVVAQNEKFIPSQEMIVQSKQLDPRAQILHDYFAQYNSPLQYHAQDFIDASDQYGVDWKLVPAISGVESTFGKQIPGGYNGWGWGVYGTQAIYFGSWRDAIFTVTKGLKENYINKGLTDPYEMNTVYASSPYWGGHVEYFLEDINSFAAKYPQTTKVAAGTPTITNPTAGESGTLANQAITSINPDRLAFSF